MAPNDSVPLGLTSAASETTYLVLIQVVSRALTFLANQVLLRYISPGILGVAAQLELYAVTALYFSRESIRVALQRQPAGYDIVSSGSVMDKFHPDIPERSGTSSHQEDSQAVVNFSYLAAALGGPLIYILGQFYVRFANRDVLDVPFFNNSLELFGLACFLELLGEPCFAIVQKRMLYKTRALVETSAAVMKAMITCGTSIWAVRSANDVGVLPFAMGQITYAVLVLFAYFITIGSHAKCDGFSVFPFPICYQDKTKYLLSLFSRPLLSLSVNIYAQSVVKHVLTQGDSMALAAFSTLEDQGLYALASNYGSLVARIFLQPIEESSRNMFGKLLASNGAEMTKPEAVAMAKSYLNDILRTYGILSIMICALGPTIVPELLNILIGSQWSSPTIHGLLSNYCYYIPLLAFNGITEAFVASTATHSELRQQAGWMGACSAGFVAAAYLFLRVWKLGASGIIWANLMNLILRIVWSYWFIRKYFRNRKDCFNITEALPKYESVATGVLAHAILWGLQPAYESGLSDILKMIVVGGIFSVLILFLESKYLIELYTKHRTAKTNPDL
ncbi:hypothetical protein PABG_06391 [Paracoccidioides brasiliensis Pb03]|nr:hypothetical protein PABG_06391 [Paracoccidioides brasiliensis Pb03]